ncbi:unnamed protein product [Malus baccata var. baccata]
MSFLHLFVSTHIACVSPTKGHCNHCQIHIALLGETLIMTLGTTYNSIIQNHSLALTKLEIEMGQIVQATNEHQSDEEPYTPPKPYVPPIPFLGRFVKQKHDEPLIDVLEEIVPDIVFEALPQSSNSIECFSKSMSDSPCFTSFQDMASHFIHKERQKRHNNQVLVEIQCTIFKVPRKKPLLPTMVRRYLDFLPP